MIKIRCVVERITYQNPENGYSVLKCAVKNYNDLVTVVGNLVDVNVGSVLLIDGNWKVDAKYGRQFLAESWEETMPATVFGIEKYLGSGLIKGVGPKFARKIVQQFGTDTLEIIETDVKRLLEVPGIGKKRVDKITESWERQKEIKNVMLFLQDHGVSTAFAAKIYRQYGNESIQKVRENPFRLADDIWGIGFKTADSIAMKLGIGKEAFIRLRSGIMYTLSELADEGHVYAEREQLIRKASELLEAEYTSIIMTMDQMLKDEELIREKIMVPQFAPDEVVPEDAAKEVERECIYLPPFYYAEVGVANKLKKLSEEPAGDRLWISLMKARQKTGNSELSVDVEKIQKAVNMEYDQVQAEAIRRAATAKVLVLTGGPGTGKTTTTQGIIAAYRTFGLRILLAAPTGRAAKRMTEACGYEAQTIHRMLEISGGVPDGDRKSVAGLSMFFERNEDNPLEADVIIVDEMSMVDISIMNSLLKAVSIGTKLILVGDVDQLPSVGPGNVLKDIIESGCFPVVKLERIFRQAAQSEIIINAHKINRGEEVVLNKYSKDFLFVHRNGADNIINAMKTLIKDKLPDYVGADVYDLQILTPSRKSNVGVERLNKIMQDFLNPADAIKQERQVGDVTFREGDKVMQIKNDYQLAWEKRSRYGIPTEQGTGAFNGDTGVIERISTFDENVTVKFEDGRFVTYEFSQLDELELAYAITVHKSQGSEYPAVIIPMSQGPRMLMNRNILYTAVTRARKCVCLVGEEEIFRLMADNVSESKRYSSLTDRIEEIRHIEDFGQ